MINPIPSHLLWDHTIVKRRRITHKPSNKGKRVAAIPEDSDGDDSGKAGEDAARTKGMYFTNILFLY